VDIPKDGVEGVILFQAGQFGGSSLYVKNGKPKYVYNSTASMLRSCSSTPIISTQNTFISAPST
jgi:arylsulfatase